MAAAPVGRGEVVWSPPADAPDASRIGEFLGWLAAERGLAFSGYGDLWAWSVADLEGFWDAVGEWSGMRWHSRPSRVLAHGDRSMPGSRWFPGGTMNYAEQALAFATREPGQVAVVACSQTRGRAELTGAELADAVARCRAGLVRLGVGAGDRVVAYAPNIPETLVAFLAAASLGAVWSSCPPEFGTRAVVDRFAQIEPTVLLAVDGYCYGTRVVDRGGDVDDIAAALPTLRHVVPVRYLGSGRDGWSELLAQPAPLAFDAVASDHPLYVLFSSGTTGLPKAIVHGHAGIAAEHLKVLGLHQDLRVGDRFCWFTTTGWMMWNYLVSGLLVGASVVLFDGDPGHPDLSTLWRLAESEHVDVLGVSAPFLMACRKAGLAPGRELDLSHLRAVGSTGAPLPPDGFRWVRDAVGEQVQVTSISGGTDVCTAFVGMVPLLPVRAGEISCRLLGCDVHAFDPAGAECPPDVQGEMVITAPMPSMPVGLWADPGDEAYRAAYFSEYPGVWRHGDWITFFDDGACTITGRSDATLNRGGVRLGTSDFYAVVEALPEVADSLVVHLERDDGLGELILFVSLAPGAVLDDGLRGRIAGALRAQLSPRHVPDRIDAVPGIPRTLSGKKLEVPVKRILTGTPADRAASRGSLANPEVLDAFTAYAP
ncbi:MAG: acetoacetate--CoA ligase [Acidimicrobiia bacterium]